MSTGSLAVTPNAQLTAARYRAAWRMSRSEGSSRPSSWDLHGKSRSLSIISARDEVEVVQAKRRKVQERLRRLAKTYVDGVYDDQEYKRQKRNLEMELESLVVPKAAAAAEAGKLIERLPELWSGANMEERRKLLAAMLDAVYVDTKDARSVVAIKPKAPFRPVFHLATTRAGSGVSLTPGPDRKQQERTERVFEAAFS